MWKSLLVSRRLRREVILILLLRPALTFEESTSTLPDWTAAAASPTELRTAHQFLRAFFTTKFIRAIVLFTCSSQETLALVRAFESLLSVALSEQDALKNRQSLAGLGVYVNLSCEAGLQALLTASHDLALNGSVSWLAWTSEGFSRIHGYLKHLNLTLNSDFTLAESIPGEIQLVDVFKVAYDWPLLWRRGGSWSEQRGLRFSSAPRATLHARRLKAAVVLHQMPIDENAAQSQDSLQRALVDQSHTNMDSETRFGFALFTHLAELFNFTLDIQPTPSWGYAQPNGSFDGMVGMLQRQEIEVGITPAVITPQRLAVVDFTVQTWKLRTCFIFRHPRLLVPYKALVDPLEADSWLGVALVAAAGVAVLWAVRRWESGSSRECVGEVVLVVIAILSQQGSRLDSHLVSGRTVLLSGFLLSVMLQNFYTSAIVTSLLTPIPRTIRTARDLVRSPLHLGLEDYSYNRAVFLIQPFWKNGGFFSVAEGIALVRKGDFAFYSEDSTLYKPIQDTFSDDEKCSLSEVELNAAFITAATVLKHSPYRELFNRGFLLT